MALSTDQKSLIEFLRAKADFVDAEVLTDITDAAYTFPEFDLAALRDALSTGQIGSKIWLADKMKDLVDQDAIVLVVGGWIGTLSRIIFKNADVRFIMSLDIDELSNKMASQINHKFNQSFSTVTRDMYDVTPAEYAEFDVVINTSCEHIDNLGVWTSLLKPGTLLFAQSNDFFSCPQHVNCVNSVDEFENQLGLSEVIYKGELQFPGVYNRFMIIGRV